MLTAPTAPTTSPTRTGDTNRNEGLQSLACVLEEVLRGFIVVPHFEERAEHHGADKRKAAYSGDRCHK